MIKEHSSSRILHQTTHGDQSPNIVTESGDVHITYTTTGVTQAQFDQLTAELEVSRATATRLLENLDEKDVTLEERSAEFESLVKKYKTLEQHLAERDDVISTQARELLNQGNLEEAETLLKDSLSARLTNLQGQRELAAADAYVIY